jgi:hydroxyacylglutathione hydrolase
VKLHDNLYVYEWASAYDNNCNTYVISGDVTLLIDPGHSRFMDSLFARMEEDGLSPDSIRVVLLTHSHPDHVEGVQAFVEKPIRIAMSGEEERYLREMGGTPPGFEIDFYLRRGTLRLGGKDFETFLCPGHSPGSLSLYWPAKKALFTGDVIFSRGVGRTDFPGGDSQALAESIEELSRLDTEAVLPGHGEVILGKEAVLENYDMIRRSFYPYL